MRAVVSIFGISPFRIGGQEVFARELSAQLGRHGWTSVLCWMGEPPPAVKGYLHLPNVRFEVIEDPARTDWKTIRQIAAVLRRHPARVLHLHYMGFLSPYPWLARLLQVERVFFTDHGSRSEGHVPRRAPSWKRLAGRLINLPLTSVVCVSDYGLRCMRALDLLPSQRFTRIYNAVDRRRVKSGSALAVAFRRRYDIPADRLLVTQVSWMIPEKGIVDLLQAAQIALRQDSNLHFALVGEGAFRPQYSELATRMGINGHVTWTGTVEDPFAAGVYAAADIVCQVSRWEEAFGYVIAEAMAWGKPVIGTRVGGIPEVICDGQTGLLVEKGNSPEMAEAILRLARTPELRHRLGETGALAAATKFDVARNVARLLEFYGVIDDEAPTCASFSGVQRDSRQQPCSHR